MAVDINDDNSLNEKAVNFWEKNKKNIILVGIFFVAIYLSLNFYFASQQKSQLDEPHVGRLSRLHGRHWIGLD